MVLFRLVAPFLETRLGNHSTHSDTGSPLAKVKPETASHPPTTPSARDLGKHADTSRARHCNKTPTCCPNTFPCMYSQVWFQTETASKHAHAKAMGRSDHAWRARCQKASPNLGPYGWRPLNFSSVANNMSELSEQVTLTDLTAQA